LVKKSLSLSFLLLQMELADPSQPELFFLMLCLLLSLALDLKRSTELCFSPGLELPFHILSILPLPLTFLLLLSPSRRCSQLRLCPGIL
jgi:hypothetical protein